MPFLARPGFAHKPEIPPTVSAAKVTSVGAATRSMRSSNGPRAAVPASLPFTGATLDRRAVAATESPWLTGCTDNHGAFAEASLGI